MHLYKVMSKLIDDNLTRIQLATQSSITTQTIIVTEQRGHALNPKLKLSMMWIFDESMEPSVEYSYMVCDSLQKLVPSKHHTYNKVNNIHSLDPLHWLYFTLLSYSYNYFAVCSPMTCFCSFSYSLPMHTNHHGNYNLYKIL